ncbi:MAG TPA: type II secretion system minor pseudopilin GspI [Pseudomonadales bacterium]|nr:type II secretion system minor pseudopilin GspI [Pseudomonadales bacterium]
MTKQRGFTLVEVMVALAVVALALPAMLGAMITTADGTSHMRDKALAQWVAANQLSEFRLAAQLKGDMPRDGARGETDMAGRAWYWVLKTENTEVAGLVRWQIRVSDQPLRAIEDPAMADLNSFVAVLK